MDNELIAITVIASVIGGVTSSIISYHYSAFLKNEPPKNAYIRRVPI